MTVALAKDFSDLDSSHWAYSYVSSLTDQGVINGYEDGTYRPDGTITRAEFVKLMVCTQDEFVKIINEIEKADTMTEEFVNWWDKYTFVIDDFYGMNPYEWTSGDYKDPITRTEMANLVYKFLVENEIVEEEKPRIDEKETRKLIDLMKEKAYDLGWIDKKTISDSDFWSIYDSKEYEEQDDLMTLVNAEYVVPPKKEVIPAFDDIKDLYRSDIVAINASKQFGIINGYEDGTFRPKNKMTRAEVAVVISNYLKTMKGV